MENLKLTKRNIGNENVENKRTKFDEQVDSDGNGVIFGDSWVSVKRLESKLTGCKNLEPPHYQLNITPHASNNKNYVKVLMLSEGGTTWKNIIDKKQKLKLWIESEPKWTVINTGACDISNRKLVLGLKDKGVGVEFVEFVIENIKSMLEFAKSSLEGKRYEEWCEKHTFLVAQLPDWCDFIQCREYGMESEEYRNIRRKVNHKLKLNKGKLYKEAKAIIFCPPSERPTMKGVHLDRASQEKYNDQIIRAISKIVCDKCKILEHNKNSIANILQPSKCDS